MVDNLSKRNLEMAEITAALVKELRERLAKA
jgi:hypothetical protein